MAKTLEVSERYLSGLIAKGVVPVYRLGKIVFLDPEEVYETIRRNGSTRLSRSEQSNDQDGEPSA